MEDRRRDDTPETATGSPPSRKPQPGSYYYDDGTGYETYDPAAETDEDDSDAEETRTD